jgi:hypothetical protein
MPYVLEARAYASGPMAPARSACGELAEETLESAGRGDYQYASRPRHHPPLRVRNTSRGEHEPAGAGLELPIADLENVLAFKDVEQLVLVRVDVKRRVDGLVLLEDRECSTRRLG